MRGSIHFLNWSWTVAAPGKGGFMRAIRVTIKLISVAVAACVVTLGSLPASTAGVDKLYVLYCGEGTAPDQSLWSPGVNVGVPLLLSDNCYLIYHAQGWFLWDTGLDDAVAAMPEGIKGVNRLPDFKRRVTLLSQLEALGVKPSDIKAMAISYTHPDHVGNVELFPQAMLYVQKAEYDWPGANNAPRFNRNHPVTLLDGDRDVFGDGSIVILSKRPVTRRATSRCWSGHRRPER
jgi:N-acyl homoserine lactone hydrolase